MMTAEVQFTLRSRHVASAGKIKTIVEELLGLLTEAGEAIEPGGSKSPTFA